MSRAVLISIIGFAAAAAALGLTMSLGWEGEPVRATAQGPAVAAVMAAADDAAPSFDVVRIGEHGDAVLAGRAQPKAEVVLMDNGRELGRTSADDRGEWVLVPTEPLVAGGHSLSVEARTAAGEVLASSRPVIMVVPGDAAQPALAVAPQPQGGARLMLGPGGDAGPVSVDLADRDEAGRLFVTGRAPAGAMIQVYFDNRFAGRTRSDGEGGWRLALEVLPSSGTLRADRVDDKGRVQARVEVPLAPPPHGVAGEDGVAVEPGASQWTVSRRANGGAYTIIYGASKDRVRDPARIYPGQVVPGQVVQVPRN